MANTVYVKVDNLTDVLATYDRIKIYRSATADGVFAEITSSGTRPVLNNQDNSYSFVDGAGIATDYYKSSYFHSVNLVESTQSDAALATPAAQIAENQQIVITVSGLIEDTDGNALGDDQEFYFTTKYTPMYSSIRRMRLEIGSYLKDLPDDTINLAIYVASKEADALSFAKDSGTEIYRMARRQWATCRAAEILLNNLINGAGGLLKSKRLADFSVEYDSKAIDNILSKVRECQARWEPELMTGGAAVQTPRGVVKGEYDPDRPDVGRLWDAGDGYPLGNGRVLYPGSRRWLSNYYPGKKRTD